MRSEKEKLIIDRIKKGYGLAPIYQHPTQSNTLKKLEEEESMSNILNHVNCPMRTKLGNCNCGGGFCTSVKKEVCDALHEAYRIGFLNGQRYEKKRRIDEKCR